MARATADVKLKQETPGERLFALRAELAKRGLAGFVVPRADEHQGEYVAPRSERLAWLTGFTGSAGAAVVPLDKAAVFVDGRYTLQARDEVDTALFEIRHLTESPPAEWIAANLLRGTRLGFDPWLHAENGAKSLAASCEKAGAELVPCADQSPRCGMARSAGSAPWPGGGSRIALCRAEQRRETRRHRGGYRQGGGRDRGSDRSLLDQLAAQHSRQRSHLHAGRTRLRID